MEIRHKPRNPYDFDGSSLSKGEKSEQEFADILIIHGAKKVTSGTKIQDKKLGIDLIAYFDKKVLYQVKAQERNTPDDYYRVLIKGWYHKNNGIFGYQSHFIAFDRPNKNLFVVVSIPKIVDFVNKLNITKSTYNREEAIRNQWLYLRPSGNVNGNLKGDDVFLYLSRENIKQIGFDGVYEKLKNINDNLTIPEKTRDITDLPEIPLDQKFLDFRENNDHKK